MRELLHAAGEKGVGEEGVWEVFYGGGELFVVAG